MTAAQKLIEALAIAFTILVAIAVIFAITYVVGLLADKAFGNHLLPRLLVVALIVSVLGWLVFRKPGTGSRL
jgi:hypothetical protein